MFLVKAPGHLRCIVTQPGTMLKYTTGSCSMPSIMDSPEINRNRVGYALLVYSPNPWDFFAKCYSACLNLATYSGTGRTFGLRVAMFPSHDTLYREQLPLAGFRVDQASTRSVRIWMDDGKSDSAVGRPVLRVGIASRGNSDPGLFEIQCRGW